jgi:uncharacterized protein (TIGR03790 family)
MKRILFFLFVCFLCSLTAEVQAQTWANIAGPGNVLVVYNSNSQVSDSVMNYYVSMRKIPNPLNVCPLDSLMDSTVTINGITHQIVIAQNGDIIRDLNQVNSDNPSFHAWKYFLDRIADPIKNYLDNNNLTTTIRYIVLCKGIPFKIQARYNGGGYAYTAKGNLPVDGLLCMLNTPGYDSVIANNVYPNGMITNPYYRKDENMTMNYRFITNHFAFGAYHLSYLVSHIDGINYNVVKSIIDRSVDADKSGNGIYILDADPTLSSFNSWFYNAKTKLEGLGFNVKYNTDNEWVTSNTYSGSPIMGYSSCGTHAEDGNCDFNDSAYVVDSLQFQYANGALFSTLESFNGTSLTTLQWRYVNPNNPNNPCNHTQGLLTQFPEVGGTGGVANAWEPDGELVYFETYYASYAVGYGAVDAAYLGMPLLAWQTVVLGDPLTTIAWGKQTIEGNSSMEGTNLVTDTVRINANDTLTISSGAAINSRIHGLIIGGENLIVGSNVTFASDSWQRALVMANYRNHPELHWSTNPGMSPIAYYLIFRKVGSGNWARVDSVTGYSWTDNQLVFDTTSGIGLSNIVYYYVKSGNNGGLSEASNTVQAAVNKARQKIAEQAPQIVHTFSLLQNYPNPFNPTTTIKYSIKNDGMVTLKIYDILGREVMSLVNENQTAGEHSMTFNATSLPSGIYIYRLQSGGFVSSKKMVLLK